MRTFYIVTLTITVLCMIAILLDWERREAEVRKLERHIRDLTGKTPKQILKDKNERTKK